MDQKQFWTTVVIALVVAVVSSVVTVKVMGDDLGLGPRTAGPEPQTIVNAHQCNADGVCEVDGIIRSPNALTLSSESGFTKVEGDLTLTKLGQSKGVLFKTNNIGSLTIIPMSGFMKLVSDLTLTSEGSSGNVILKNNQQGTFIITPSSGYTKIEGTLSTSTLAGNSNAYACVNNLGQLYRSNVTCV